MFVGFGRVGGDCVRLDPLMMDLILFPPKTSLVVQLNWGGEWGKYLGRTGASAEAMDVM
jgi:hypothetical protein